MDFSAVHIGAFCQFPFQRIYYHHSGKSTGKETGKTLLCAVVKMGNMRSVLLVSTYYHASLLPPQNGNIEAVWERAGIK